jgi:hypothetical protein
MQAEIGRGGWPALGGAADVRATMLRLKRCSARKAARRAADMSELVNIASTPSPISFRTSPPPSWTASIAACA